MKMRDSIPFYRILSIFTSALTVLLLIRRIIVIEYAPINVLIALFWPIIGAYVTLQFVNRDGYTFSVAEGLFLLLLLYCALYFLIDTIIVVPQGLISVEILSLNVIIIILGWLGILSYVFL